MQENWKKLLSLFPSAPDWQIDWDGLKQTQLQPYFEQMADTHQNPIWHGEDDVWTHTMMVCTELAAKPAFRILEKRKQQEVFLAALLHDIGKIPCTKLEDGVWVSPAHTSTGARMAREILWSLYGLSGSREACRFRETVCTLIRYHSVPLHMLEQESPEYRLIRIAADGELAEDFSIELLCMLVEADVQGRICVDKQEALETVQICAEVADSAGCLRKPFGFPSEYTKHCYLNGRSEVPDVELYDDTWGKVILLSGLPGTGKDTWIQERYPDLPVVSLDVLRKQMNISPKDDQGAVANAAKELAKEYLRKKQSFVWNATNTTPMIRGKQIQLFENYHAAVQIDFLETGWEEELRRNQARKEEVPETVIRHMLQGLILPERFEAQYVTWNQV